LVLDDKKPDQEEKVLVGRIGVVQQQGPRGVTVDVKI
jgi:hypothetical protein